MPPLPRHSGHALTSREVGKRRRHNVPEPAIAGTTRGCASDFREGERKASAASATTGRRRLTAQAASGEGELPGLATFPKVGDCAPSMMVSVPRRRGRNRRTFKNAFRILFCAEFVNRLAICSLRDAKGLAHRCTWFQRIPFSDRH